MKAGTTTLYRDLLTSPDVYIPVDKEPGHLASDWILSDQGREEYERLYRRGKNCPVRIDASTHYAKLPDFAGVPERAYQVLGSDCYIVYVCRHPFYRALSHYYHDYSRGQAPSNINDAIVRESRYMNYSRYAMQLKPWLDLFGHERTFVINFSEYVANRRGVVASLAEELNIRHDPSDIEVEANYNPTSGGPVLSKGWALVRDRAVYQRALRPLLSTDMRYRLRRWVLPRADLGSSESLGAQTARRLWSALEWEGPRLTELVGREFHWEPPEELADQ